MADQPKDQFEAFERALRIERRPHYRLRLYVAGATSHSIKAISNLKQICREHLQGRYQLEVIDIYQKPEMAGRDQVVAMPTLIKALPEPVRRFVGDLSDTERVLVGLDLIENNQESDP